MHKLVFCFTFFSLLCITKISSQIPQRFDLIIDEIMADPTPAVGLPNAEYIELKNTGRNTINLQGWKLKSSTVTSAPFPSYLLPVDSFLIITGSSNSSLFAGFGRVLGIASFPALNNSGTTLSILSKEGFAIHSVNYNTSWFKNDVKSGGGWSLEMIDTKNPCTEINNWKASTDVNGGTPGKKNSVDANNPDNIAPALLRAAATDSITIELTFSEPLDSLKAAIATNYQIGDGIGSPKIAIPLAPGFSSVRLTTQVALLTSKVYTITADNIADCSGNIIHAVNSTRVGVASATDTGDVIINEILFNPKPGGVDYVEIFNRTDKIFNLKDFYIANRTATTNALAGIRQLTPNNVLIFPGDFFVITENSKIVTQNYFAKNPANFIDVPMPSFPDDEGTVVILNNQGKIIDEVHYNSKWHFALINNEQGVALERLDNNRPGQSKDNWTSAASSAGFGTPTYQNSQFRIDASMQGEITVIPKTFSPDNDGFDDFTTINLKMPGTGWVANITIFDAAGRAIKDLAKNATLAPAAFYRWDGLDDKFRKVPVGVYVVITEVFNLSGKKKSFKNTVVVAARF